MRIAILTLPLNTNYGGILQAYALQTVLKKMGYEITLIDKDVRLRNPWWRFPFSLIIRCLKKYVFKKKTIVLLKEQMRNKELEIIRRNTAPFIQRHFKNRLILKHLEKDIHSDMFDAIIVGSDQIWRPLYNPMISNAFLDFTQGWNLKRIAYAVSFGSDAWEYSPEQTEYCKYLVQYFSGVSVREKSGVDFCAKYFNTSAEWVLDPTMLLNPDDYLKLCTDKDASPEREGQILTYILDITDDKNVFLKSVSHQLGRSCFCTNNPSIENYDLPPDQRMALPLEQWLKGFSQASYVVTDSFHGCVFSILFHKPFWVYANKVRGLSRFRSLLSLFHLEDRLFYSSKDVQSLSIHDALSINWMEIDVILMKMREKSMDFLMKNLGENV